MGEKELKDEFSIDWESESRRYRKLYDELVQSSQNKEENLYDEIFKVEEENSELKKEIGTLRQIIFELSGLLTNK